MQLQELFISKLWCSLEHFIGYTLNRTELIRQHWGINIEKFLLIKQMQNISEGEKGYFNKVLGWNLCNSKLYR